MNTGVWAGYFGAGHGDEADELARLLGTNSEPFVGDGFGLSASPPARLVTATDGATTTATLGDGGDNAGCAATVRPMERTLTLTGDAFGLHAAFYARRGDALWFASDPRVLRRIPGVGDGVDVAARHGYLCFSHVPSPRTMFPGVTQLPAGERLTMEPGEPPRVESTHAWREGEPFAGSQDDAVAALRARLQDAACRRWDGDEAVGVFLSGGLDSSVVAALLARNGARVRLFTLDFGPPFDAELPHARAVAAHLKLPLDVVPCRARDVQGALPHAAAALHQPFGDGVVVPLWLLGRAASDHVATVFNGEGGDQLFGGWANKPMVAAEAYAGGGYDREAAYLATYHRFHGLFDRLYTPPAITATCGIDAGAWVGPALNAPGFGSLLHRLRAANLRLKGAQNIAPRCVQLAGAHGLSVRAPFFDRILADWSFALPPAWLLQGACEKYLLKRAAEPFLPADIVWRDKRGMGVPVTEWCLGPLRRDIARRLSPGRLRRDGCFDPGFVAALRRGEDRPGEFRSRRVGEKLWSLLMLHEWQAQQGDWS